MTQESGSQQWQVTCQCGWRTHGLRDTVGLAAVQEHGRQAHQRELSAEEVMAIAVPLQAAP